jgi:hypothetical protein
MERRDFLKIVGAAGGAAALGCNGSTLPGAHAASAADAADAHRYVMHTLSGGLDFYFGTETTNPLFERIVSPSRKFLGDNPDAIYPSSRAGYRRHLTYSTSPRSPATSHLRPWTRRMRWRPT